VKRLIFPAIFILTILLLVAAFSACSGDDDDDDDSASDDDDSDGDDDDNDSADDDDDDDDDDTNEPPYEAPDGLEVVFFNVGQGDAALVRFPEGSTMLVDGGPNSVGDFVILPFFEDLHMKELTVLVISHPDADHVGGLDDVVDGIDVGEVWENGQTKDTSAWNDFSDAVDDAGIDRVVMERGDSRTIDGCDIDFFNGDEGSSDFNTNSLVFTIFCSDGSVLFTGDATENTQEDLIATFDDELKADLVKVPHHGSPDRESNFPDYVLPEIAVFSVGASNPYGHPDPGVMSEWSGVGASLYRTDQDGTVTVLAQSGVLTASTEN
jgi:competence protein ComEC